ncbi:MAG: coenzyme F420-0:L-glutamate ligase [Nitriliruptoraceae bacterium]
MAHKPFARAADSVSVIPVPSKTTFAYGIDLGDAIETALSRNDLTLLPCDVLLVSSKVVSLTEGATVSRDTGDLTAVRRDYARRDAHEIVADSPHVLITRTKHGFVAANGGLDASNVADQTQLLLLPEDPDRSAAALRQTLFARYNADIAVIITDTFGRPWRMGQTDVALGVSGMRPVRDERGATDLYGQVLDVTEAAIADALAGAADLVRHKASGTPFVLIRGLDPTLFDSTVDAGGQALIRDADRDLFRFGGPTAIEQGLIQRRTVRQFEADQTVPDTVIEAAVRTAIQVAAPHHSQPWHFMTLTDATRKTLLDQMATAWQKDLAQDGTAPEVIARRLKKSDALLRQAPTLLVAFVDVAAADTYGDRRRQHAEHELFMLSGGAAIQNFQVTLAAHSAASAWISAPLFCADLIRSVLDVPGTYRPLGMLAVGYPANTPPVRAIPDVNLFFTRR